MGKFKQSVAVITGAGSGIGRQLALQLAAAGANIAISDIDAASLEQTRQLLSHSNVNSKVKVSTTVLDVAEQEAVFAYAESVKNEFGQVNLVINNAGVALASGHLANTELDDFKWLMNINFYGVLYGTKAFLPILEQAEWGHIVNVSSLFGLVAVPSQTAYNASKFAVRGLSEALRQELEEAKSRVSCTSVHPGGIKTNISRFARVPDNASEALIAERSKQISHFDKIARTTAESAAAQILKAVLKNKKRLLIGADARFLDKVQRVFPTAYGKVLEWLVNSRKK